jgi:hypothetical protein
MNPKRSRHLRRRSVTAEERVKYLEGILAQVRDVLYPPENPEAPFTAEMADDVAQIVTAPECFPQRTT